MSLKHHGQLMLVSHWTVVVIIILYDSNHSLTLNCGDASSCAGNSYTCTDQICQINCNTNSSCLNTQLYCDDTHLHSPCKVTCNGNKGCDTMIVESHRDTVVHCNSLHSCDDMHIKIYGDYQNDKITANLTSTGSNTDGTHIECHGSGIDECFVDCQDNGGYYTCMDVVLDCYTPGRCRYRCESSSACCGCTTSSGPSSTLHEARLNCYWGEQNCIQVCAATYSLFLWDLNLKICWHSG